MLVSSNVSLVGKESQGTVRHTAEIPPSTFPSEAAGRSQTLRPRTPPQHTKEARSHRDPSPTPFSHLRLGVSSRPSSPASSNHKPPSVHAGNSTIRHRPSSIMVQPPAAAAHSRDMPQLSKLSATNHQGLPAFEEKSQNLPPASSFPQHHPPTKPLNQSRKRGTVAPQAPDDGLLRRDQNIRISFFDPTNQVALDRLIAGEAGTQSDNEGDDENSLATVEDMIEGYEWASDDVMGRKPSRATADLIEARLLNELMALEKVCGQETSWKVISLCWTGKYPFIPRI